MLGYDNASGMDRVLQEYKCSRNRQAMVLMTWGSTGAVARLGVPEGGNREDKILFTTFEVSSEIVVNIESGSINVAVDQLCRGIGLPRYCTIAAKIFRPMGACTRVRALLPRQTQPA